MATAIVKLDSLANAVGPAAEDHDAFSPGRFGWDLVFGFVRRVVVWRVGFELGGARVDRFERGHDAAPFALGTKLHFDYVPGVRKLAIGKAKLLRAAKHLVADSHRSPDRAELVFELDNLRKLVEKPRVDRRQLVNLIL